MSLPPKYTLSLYAGDDKPFKVRWKDNAGVPIDLTGVIAKMQFKVSPCEDAVFTVIGLIADPATGEIIFIITGAEKQALIADCQTTCYLYDVQLTLPSTDIETIVRGTVRIEEDITE